VYDVYVISGDELFWFVSYLLASFNFTGCKVQATIRKQLIYVFQRRLKEGEIYKISFFSVAPNTGSYRSATHPYKIVFQMTTKVQPCTSSLIPLYGLSFTSIVDVSNHTIEYDYLVGMF
jgi:replication factor A1